MLWIINVRHLIASWIGPGRLPAPRVRPSGWPAKSADPRGESGRSQWVFDVPGGGERCGLALARVLAEEVIPHMRMRRLVDRQALLEEVRKPSLPLVVRLDPERREIVLRIESAPSSEIEGLLSRVDPTAPARAHFERWARDRLAERGAKGE